MEDSFFEVVVDRIWWMFCFCVPTLIKFGINLPESNHNWVWISNYSFLNMFSSLILCLMSRNFSCFCSLQVLCATRLVLPLLMVIIMLRSPNTGECRGVGIRLCSSTWILLLRKSSVTVFRMFKLFMGNSIENLLHSTA